ncbi:MAG: DUF3618 domain-containing protein [Actinobacteria bacterium]|nr:DUF3618 domain-containing protein [Actinomycetota bacterium]
MGEETARLRREIDRTRGDLTRDVDMIAEKTSPSRIVERRVERTRQGLTGLKDRIMGHSDDAPGRDGDPYGAGYYGAGYSGGGRYEYPGDPGAPGGDDGPGVADRLRGGVGSARESVGSAKAGLSDATSTMTHRARDQAEGNPLAAGLVAFGIGWLVSSVLPASQAETRAARQAQDAARSHGGPIAEQAKQAASEIGENLKGTAQEAVDQVKGHAQEAAQQVRDDGMSAAQTVRDDARSQTSSGSGATGASEAAQPIGTTAGTGTARTTRSTAPGSTLGSTSGSTADDTGAAAAGRPDAGRTEPDERIL